jgi:DNA-binding NarL/FixJ family response regulator
MGYLLKDRVSDLVELADAVRRVGARGTVLDPTVVSMLVGRPRQGPDGLEELTERERGVLALMAEGRTNAAIGERLFISERTVKAHLTRVFQQLGVTDRTQAALWAR